MEDAQLDQWMADFEKQMEVIQIEFDAFFANQRIQDYVKHTINHQGGGLSLDVVRREDLPNEILDRITRAYLDTKPK